MGQKHFESKWVIEQYLKELGLPHTILRPAAFMDNLNWQRAEISNGTYRGFGVAADKKTQTIAVEDIGAIAAIVFSEQQEYLGTTLEISGDELTEMETAETLTKVIGRPVTLGQPQTFDEDYISAEEQSAMYSFFNGEAYTADIAALRKIHPNLQTFEQYLRDTGWENLPVSPMPENVN